jgi:hypothetical protein
MCGPSACSTPCIYTGFTAKNIISVLSATVAAPPSSAFPTARTPRDSTTARRPGLRTEASMCARLRPEEQKPRIMASPIAPAPIKPMRSLRPERGSEEAAAEAEEEGEGSSTGDGSGWAEAAAIVEHLYT